MATIALCGMTGSTSLGGEVSKWTLNINQEIIDVTSMASSGNKEYIGCLRDADGTFDSYTPAGGTGSVTALTLTNAKASWSFNAIVDSIQTSLDVHGVVKFTYGFKSSGAITGIAIGMIGQSN